VFCSLSSKTAEFGAGSGLCKAPAAATAPEDLLSRTGLAKHGILQPSSLCPQHRSGKKLCQPGASACKAWCIGVREFQLEFGTIQINDLLCRAREVLAERLCTPHAQ